MLKAALHMRENVQRTLDVLCAWRHAGAMPDSPASPTVQLLDRLNLRLAPETFSAIDAARALRPGSVSRNTWIAEAVQEKLARTADAPQTSEGALRHG